MTTAASVTSPDVTIVIVNYNVKEFLQGCLESIYESTGDVSYEIIVVDNNSSDNSVNHLQSKFPSVIWEPLNENVGFGRANNIGIAKARGRYTLLLNPDTIVSPDTLSTMVSYLDTNPMVGLAGCKVLNADGSFQVACRRGFPTPWASFCKLFGLQRLFPTSRLFARYNLTYLSVDETYDVDALIGAFMIGPTKRLLEVGGFDPSFFMYGEDLDLCYRVQQQGYHIRYVHTTSIVHYKGESTKRSSLNEVRVFYEAMEIFARKHYGKSTLFLWFLRMGINLRAVTERIRRSWTHALIALLDVVSVIVALLISTTVRFETPLGFPDYAYPLVLFAVPLLMVMGMLAVGEYVEYKPTIRRSLAGLLITFFALVSLTYFFKEYAFSRGVLLMTIGITAALFVLTRSIAALMSTISKAGATKRVLVVGTGNQAQRLVSALQTADAPHTIVVGCVTGANSVASFDSVPVLGDVAYIDRVIASHQVSEVVIADEAMSHTNTLELLLKARDSQVRFHVAAMYDELVAARVINDVSGVAPTLSVPPLFRFRNRFAKRLFDFTVAALLLPMFALASVFSDAAKVLTKSWNRVLWGKMSVVGVYATERRRDAAKPGITGFVHVAGPSTLSPQTISQLNDYYVEHYSISIDIEILLKSILKKQS